MQYIPAKNHGGPANFPIVRVVIHGTVSPCRPGQAVLTARMFAATSRDASTQKVHDPTTSVRCVPDNVIAYGAPPNKGSLHHELCDPQTGSPARWQDANHEAMLRLAAADVAADCKEYGIPVRHLTVSQLRAGEKGICGHDDISAAWHQTDHTDPGVGFPWTHFLNLVKTALNPPKPPVQTGAVDMFAIKLKSGPQASAQFLSTGTERRWIPNQAALLELQSAHAISSSPILVDTAQQMVDVAGPLVGTAPAGWTEPTGATS